MSIKIMTKVWDDAPVADTRLLVLLALADSANDDGECWPGIKHIAKKARLSETRARRILHELERDGLIEIVKNAGKGRYEGQKTNLYRITPDAWDTIETALAEATPIQEETPGADASSTPGAGDRGTTIADASSTPGAGDSQNHQYEPSGEPSIQPTAPGGAGVVQPSSLNSQPQEVAFDIQRIFDCIAWTAWGIRDMRALRSIQGVKNPAAVRIGKICAWLTHQYPGMEEKDIAAKVVEFKQVWKDRKKYQIPRDDGKFAGEWLAWEQEHLPAPDAAPQTGFVAKRKVVET